MSTNLQTLASCHSIRLWSRISSSCSGNTCKDGTFEKYNRKAHLFTSTLSSWALSTNSVRNYYEYASSYKEPIGFPPQVACPLSLFWLCTCADRSSQPRQIQSWRIKILRTDWIFLKPLHWIIDRRLRSPVSCTENSTDVPDIRICYPNVRPDEHPQLAVHGLDTVLSLQNASGLPSLRSGSVS